MALINLADNDIHLWCAWDENITNNILLARYWELLSADERERQRRFHFTRHRHQYLVSRALMRCVLSLYAEPAPVAWRFCNNAFGKPEIANANSGGLSFNLSHSDRLVVLAVAAGGELGVDVEWQGRSGSLVELADHYFAPAEVCQLRALPASAQRSRFLDFWTLKEAYIKACGLGLSIPLHHFSYHFCDNGEVGIEFHAERDDCPEQWQFWQVGVGDEHKLALACRQHKRVARKLLVRDIVPLEGYCDRPAVWVHSMPQPRLL